MRDTSRKIKLHPIIDLTISRIEMQEWSVIDFEEMLAWYESDKATVEFSEDEFVINQNWLGSRELDDDYEDYIRQELEYHKGELANQKILLRIYMEAFNGGWIF